MKEEGHAPQNCLIFFLNSSTGMDFFAAGATFYLMSG